MKMSDTIGKMLSKDPKDRMLAEYWQTKTRYRKLKAFANRIEAARLQENPQYSIIVCMEKGMPAYGGSMCGPIYKQIAETLWARTMRADLKTACDTSRLRHMPPTTRRGNLLALSNVLDEMNISYERCYENKQSLAWGQACQQQARFPHWPLPVVTTTSTHSRSTWYTCLI